jgi:hypothetical protein
MPLVTVISSGVSTSGAAAPCQRRSTSSSCVRRRVGEEPDVGLANADGCSMVRWIPVGRVAEAVLEFRF